MARIGSLGLVAVAMLMLACGGSDSVLPQGVQSAMQDTRNSIEEGDGEAACQAIAGITNALYEWQEFARGNQGPLTEEMISTLRGSTNACGTGDMALRGEQAEIDIESLGRAFTEWDERYSKRTQRKSGFMTIFMWVIIPILIGGFLMYWRRKFREA